MLRWCCLRSGAASAVVCCICCFGHDHLVMYLPRAYPHTVVVGGCGKVGALGVDVDARKRHTWEGMVMVVITCRCSACVCKCTRWDGDCVVPCVGTHVFLSIIMLYTHER